MELLVLQWAVTDNSVTEEPIAVTHQPPAEVTEMGLLLRAVTKALLPLPPCRRLDPSCRGAQNSLGGSPGLGCAPEPEGLIGGLPRSPATETCPWEASVPGAGPVGRTGIPTRSQALTGLEQNFP